MEEFKRRKKNDYQVSRIRTWLVCNRDLTPMALKVMLLWLDEPDWRHPAQKEYAKRLGTSQKIIYRAFKVLRRQGLLEDITQYEAPTGDYRSRAYQITEHLLAQVFRKRDASWN